MVNAVFTSIDGGKAHQKLLLDQIESSRRLAIETGADVCLQIMCFAFTDKTVAEALRAFVQSGPRTRVDILADWSQGAVKSPSAVKALAADNIDGLRVRLKIDTPYFLSPKTGRVTWGYHHSHGMLHHKTMCLRVDGVAQSLIFGSYNWSGRGAQAYENSLVMDRNAETAATLDAFDAEFGALWANPMASMPIENGADFAIKARKVVQAGGNLQDRQTLADLLGITPQEPETPLHNTLVKDQTLPAFSGHGLTAQRAHYGFAKQNAARKMNMLRPKGSRKLVPVTLNAVALEGIRNVQDGNRLDVAMYALSPRVPEYAALLDAARRGCQVRILLDGTIGFETAERIQNAAMDENLPISVRTTRRRMHQKYILGSDDNVVVTGTANMTEDATTRHAEHRILFLEAPALSRQFETDFNQIWARLPPN